MPKKSIVLADCKQDELSSFLEAIKSEGIEIECKSIVSNEGRGKFFSNFVRYLKYFYAPIVTMIKRNEYECIVGWQQFYALIFCFWCQLFHLKKVNRVIVVNFTYKEKRGLRGIIYHWFMKKCVCTGYADYFHVPSMQYAEKASKLFGVSRDRFIVSPFGIDDMMDRYGNSPKPQNAPLDYSLSIGRSNRDYDFLIEVWKGIDDNLVIISDEYRRSNLPSNILLINDVSGDKQYPWISNCRSLIIPIDNVEICSGDTVLLTAMSLAKTIFVTNPSTLSEMYVEDKVNAVYINKNVDETREIIKKHLSIINANDIGNNARSTFISKYSRYAMGLNISAYMN